MTDTKRPQKRARITKREAFAFCASYVDRQRPVDDGLRMFAAGWFECSADEAERVLLDIAVATGCRRPAFPASPESPDLNETR